MTTKSRSKARTVMCRNCAEDFTYSSGGGQARPLCPACEETHKWCPSCGYAVVREGFYGDARTRDGLYGTCRRCISDKHRREAWRSTPEQSRRDKLKRRYGITPEHYDEMLKGQGGRCAICDTPLDVDVARFAHVDHCHTTLHFRGILCAPCNKGLGHFQDDPDRLLAAAAYLVRAQQESVQASAVHCLRQPRAADLTARVQ